MRAKAKSSSTPYPIWVEGEYITETPIRPSDGAIRPVGHYIDKFDGAVHFLMHTEELKGAYENAERKR